MRFSEALSKTNVKRNRRHLALPPLASQVHKPHMNTPNATHKHTTSKRSTTCWPTLGRFFAITNSHPAGQQHHRSLTPALWRRPSLCENLPCVSGIKETADLMCCAWSSMDEPWRWIVWGDSLCVALLCNGGRAVCPHSQGGKGHYAHLCLALSQH